MCIMKRVFIIIFSIVSLLCATDAYSQRSIELGYSKHIFRSKTGAGYIPFLNDMGYNGMYVAFRYNMFFSDAPDSRFAAQIGVKYDFQYGRSRSDVDVHLEQYLEVPVLFKYYIRNSSSEPVASLFVGPSLSLNLSSVYKDKQEMINGTTILEEINLLRDNDYGYTVFDVLACAGVSFRVKDNIGLTLSYSLGLSNRRGLVDGEKHTEISKHYKLNSDVLNVGVVYEF